MVQILINKERIVKWFERLVFTPNQYKGYKWEKLGIKSNDNDHHDYHIFMFTYRGIKYVGFFSASKNTPTTEKSMAKYIIDHKRNTLTKIR